MRTARKLARDVVVRRAFEILAVAVIDKILVPAGWYLPPDKILGNIIQS